MDNAFFSNSPGSGISVYSCTFLLSPGAMGGKLPDLSFVSSPSSTAGLLTFESTVTFSFTEVFLPPSFVSSLKMVGERISLTIASAWRLRIKKSYRR